MARAAEYQIVGRYMSGTEVTAYHLQSLTSEKSGRFTREQVAFLVGKKQITNCEGQIYKDKLLLRGVGIQLDSLPVKQENGGMSKTDRIGKVRKDTSAADAMTQVMLNKVIVDGNRPVGYIVINAGGGTHTISREQLLELAKAGRIGNACYRKSNDRQIIRGVNCDLTKLPKISVKDIDGFGREEVKSNNTVKNNESSKIENEQTAMINKFKKTCIKYFNAFNKELGGKLENLGYDDSGYNDDGSLSSLSFWIGVKGRDSSLGISISLFNNDNKLDVSFTIAPFENGEVFDLGKVFSATSPTFEKEFKDKLLLGIKELKKYRVI